jgi:cytidylate kinase
MNNIPVITIDGPSGTGKGTVSLFLAKQLGWHYLDSGVLYRLLAYIAQQNAIDLSDTNLLLMKANEANIDFVINEAGTEKSIYLDGNNVTSSLRTEAISQMSSIVSAIPEIRAALIKRQQDFRQAPGLVTDGRDMGTLIFPGASLKIFMTASPEIRAKRRVDQLNSQGIDANLATVLQDLNQRDLRDQMRAVAPLKPAKDAIVIDTSDLAIIDVVELIMAQVKQRELIVE